MLDTETQSARSRAAIPEWTCPLATTLRSLLWRILGNVVSVTLFDVAVLFTEIIDHEHGRALMMGKSRDGSVQWHWDMATPRKDHSLKQLFTIFRDAESLARVGLVCKHDDLRGRGLKAEQVLTVGPCSLNFVAVAFGKDLLCTASYSHRIPLVFAGMLSPRREDVQSTLRHLKRVWEALTKCERDALHNRWLKKWLDVLLWPAGVWIREVFVSLLENAWQKVPPWLHDVLADVFSSFGTRDVADGFNFTRRRVRLALSGTMQPLAQWHNLAHSNLAEEVGGKPVPVEPQDRYVHEGAFRKSSFQTAEEDSSASGTDASENGWPRRMAQAFGLKLLPECQQRPRRWSNSNRTSRRCRSCGAQSFHKLGRSACTATICWSRPPAGFCTVQQWAHWL